VKAVADWLGHASPVITLETYAHLMPVDEDRARSVLDGAFQRVEDTLRTGSLGVRHRRWSGLCSSAAAVFSWKT
jgi:hypothetical protein